MKTITRLGTLVIAFAMAGTLATAASKGERSNKYFTISGVVLQIDGADRTLLVADRASNQTYLVEVPRGATFKILFGKSMQMWEPGFNDVSVRDRVKIRCFRADTEHLARLDNRPDLIGVIVVTAAH